MQSATLQMHLPLPWISFSGYHTVLSRSTEIWFYYVYWREIQISTHHSSISFRTSKFESPRTRCQFFIKITTTPQSKNLTAATIWVWLVLVILEFCPKISHSIKIRELMHVFSSFTERVLMPNFRKFKNTYQHTTKWKPTRSKKWIRFEVPSRRMKLYLCQAPPFVGLFTDIQNYVFSILINETHRTWCLDHFTSKALIKHLVTATVIYTLV